MTKAAENETPVSEPDVGPQTRYFRFLAAGQWRIQKCETCGKAVFYPRVICPFCAGAQLEWFEPSGLGVVYSTTSVSRKAEAGGNYNVALIDLDEGPRMMGRVEGLLPEEVRIGMRVKGSVICVPPAEPLVIFSSAEAQS
jgi:uncharacterized OB-fold protein